MDAARIILDQSGLPDQRRSDQAADHRVERRVAVVAKVEQAAPIGLPRRADQQEAAEHQDESGDVHRRKDPRSANRRIGGERDRRADDEAEDVGEQEQRADHVGREAKASLGPLDREREIRQCLRVGFSAAAGRRLSSIRITAAPE